MGTSNLYKGPKTTNLLPSDYIPDENPKLDSPDNNLPVDEVEPPQNMAEYESSKDQQLHQPAISWGNARSSMRRAMNDRTRENIKSAIKHYTKALGGHANATRQAVKVLGAAGSIYSFFAGTPEDIHKHLLEVGVHVDGRATKDVFQDICKLIAPIPIDLEDSLVNKALQETFADVAVDLSIDLDQLDYFNEDLLQRLVGGLIKHYIFDKLLLQSEQTALKNCEHVSDLRELEKSIKQYIDGIVDSVVPNIVKSGLNPKDFNSALETLCDITYQLMEEL